CQQLVMLGRQSVIGEALGARRVAGYATQAQGVVKQRGEGAAHGGGSGSAIAEVRPQVAVGEARLRLADVERSIVSRLTQAQLRPLRRTAVDGVKAWNGGANGAGV